jgi:hypothetical protein
MPSAVMIVARGDRDAGFSASPESYARPPFYAGTVKNAFVLGADAAGVVVARPSLLMPAAK